MSILLHSEMQQAGQLLLAKTSMQRLVQTTEKPPGQTYLSMQSNIWWYRLTAAWSMWPLLGMMRLHSSEILKALEPAEKLTLPKFL